MNAVHNAVAVGKHIGADTEDLVPHRDRNVVVGCVGDKRSEEDLGLRDGLSLSNDAESDNGV